MAPPLTPDGPLRAPEGRALVFVGFMGAGKTSAARRLARTFGLEVTDASAAGQRGARLRREAERVRNRDTDASGPEVDSDDAAGAGRGRRVGHREDFSRVRPATNKSHRLG